ncbi:MAG: YhfC family intramembrane metalloprotease [Oligoflexia bacterium]|nr:YhfC family intramembrane metalloprotease [Oligoflexia bacterium]
MLTAAYALTALLMVALPLIAAGLLTRSLGTGWGLVGAGALTFLLSQVVHIPLNIGVAALFKQGVLTAPAQAVMTWLVPIALGLSAGLCEELARWLALRGPLRRRRTWADGVTLGLGHGGVEAMILGGMLLFTLITMMSLRETDLAAMGVPAAALDTAKAQVDAFWSAPLWMVSLGLVERGLTVPIHVGMNSMVMCSVNGGGARWLLGAIGVHALLDAGALLIIPHGALLAEGWVALFAIAALVLVFKLRPPPASPADEAPPPPLMQPRRLDLAESGRLLESP